MPALAPPVADERSALREYLAFHQSSYFAVCYGLTDAQARSSPAGQRAVDRRAGQARNAHAAQLDDPGGGRANDTAGRHPAS